MPTIMNTDNQIRIEPGFEQGRSIEIERYYNALAPRYDEKIFGGSYGQYLDRQERSLLRPWLAGKARVLDLGCGTGRFLDLASHGLDRNHEMLAQARAKPPGRPLVMATASRAPFPDGSFDAIFSMHVFMHLPKAEISRTLLECRRLLCPGGTLIFDVPSQARRRLTRFRPASWHCATAYSRAELRAMSAGWLWRELHGLLAFPIHRLPAPIRPLLWPLDTALGRSPLRWWCSYYLIRLEKIL
jgi:SAM-dependent methyltransferase